MEEKEIQPAPRTLKATIWKHFGFYRQPGPGKKGLDMTYAICRDCNGKVKYFGNTSNPRSHLERHHPELLVELDNPVKTAPTRPADQRTLHHFEKLPHNCERAKNITKSIACFIAKDLRPYSAVERDGFKFMIKTIEPRYVIPSRAYFTDTAVPELYRETKLKFGEAVAKNATRVALMCDHWTSRATESYATFTGHYITEEWQLQSQVLQTRVMHESHTAQNIHATFHSVAKEWKLTLPDLVIVTDNASNMLAAMQLEENLTHVSCFAHTLNLAAQRALKLNTVSRVLGRIRRITGYFHRSTTACEALKVSQKALGLEDHKLQIDIVTRWSSQPAICAALANPGVRKNNTADTSTLSDTEIKHAEEITMALRPMRDATNIMSEDSSPTLSVIAPLLAQLLHNTGDDSDNSTLVREIKRAIHEDLAKRYSSVKTQKLLHKASTLDPRFKALPFLAKEQQLDIHENPGKADSIPVEPEASPEEGPVPKRRTTSDALVNLLGKTFTEVRVAPKSASTRSEEELNKYLDVPALSLSEDPLHWWKSNERDFPLLARLAKRYLCIPGTSVAAERVFSTAGDVVTAQRSCLSSEHVDQLIFLLAHASSDTCEASHRFFSSCC
uniref:BED-type domain-containing protein n=1 Tax=Astyanax mexicanus TaxID=7994 RepID=A0A3B1JBH7_ASTMX